MDDKTLKELIQDTTIDDIPERYHPVVNIVGIEKFAELSIYARGDELYFPKVESIVVQARNRKIIEEYNYHNEKELAGRYNLTIPQIINITKHVPYEGQMSLFPDI